MIRKVGIILGAFLLTAWTLAFVVILAGMGISGDSELWSHLSIIVIVGPLIGLMCLFLAGTICFGIGCIWCAALDAIHDDEAASE